MATHPSILAWRIPWTEEPSGLQTIGLQTVGHYWSDLAHAHTSCCYLTTSLTLRQFFDIVSFSIAFLISLDFLLLKLIGASYLLASVLYLQLKMFYNIFQVVGLLLLTDLTIIWCLIHLLKFLKPLYFIVIYKHQYRQT